MSYDLCFWKQNEKAKLIPGELCNLLRSGATNQEALPLPIEEIINKLQDFFPGMLQEESSWCWDSDGDSGSFVLNTTSRYLEFNCYNLDTDKANDIIDTLFEFGCALYDPQIDKRFEG